MNGVHPWISCQKFILSWPIILLNPRIVYHLELFLIYVPQYFTIYTQNDLKHNLSKTQLVNGVQPWISGLKFFLSWPIIVPKRRIVLHLKKFSIFLNSSMHTQNDLKQNLSKTQLVNGVQPWIFGLKFILSLS